MVYVDFLWNDESRKAWFDSPHTTRLDTLNARTQSLDVNDLVMPLSLTYQSWRYSNLQIDVSSAAVAVTFDAGGHIYRGFKADMAAQMQCVPAVQGTRLRWQGEKTDLVEFAMSCGQQIATRLREMWLEARTESLWFLRTVTDELVQGYNRWTANPELAKDFEAAVRNLATSSPLSRSSELYLATTFQDPTKRRLLEQYNYLAFYGETVQLMQFLICNKDWMALSQEERETAFEIWQVNRRKAALEVQAQVESQTPKNTLIPLIPRIDPDDNFHRR